jgi:HSP20 family protein
MNEIKKTAPERGIGRSLFSDEFDNLFEGFFRPMRANNLVNWDDTHAPAIDVTENDESYIVKADLPGIKKEDINVTVHEGMLTISAETKAENEKKDGDKVIRRERRYGKYTRSMSLGQQVDEANVKAAYKDGVLELMLPKKTEAKRQKITVDVK